MDVYQNLISGDKSPWGVQGEYGRDCLKNPTLMDIADKCIRFHRNILLFPFIDYAQMSL